MLSILFAAVIIGAVTAFHFGMRPGVSAAIASLVGFAAAAVIPGIKLWVYLAAAIGVIGVVAIGRRRVEPTVVARWTRRLRHVVASFVRRPPAR